MVCSIDMCTISAGKFTNEVDSALGVASMYGVPCLARDLVDFVWIASEGTSWLPSRTWFGSAQYGERSNRGVVGGAADNVGTFPGVGEVVFG